MLSPIEEIMAMMLHRRIPHTGDTIIEEYHDGHRKQAKYEIQKTWRGYMVHWQRYRIIWDSTSNRGCEFAETPMRVIEVLKRHVFKR